MALLKAKLQKYISLLAHTNVNCVVGEYFSWDKKFEAF